MKHILNLYQPKNVDSPSKNPNKNGVANPPKPKPLPNPLPNPYPYPGYPNPYPYPGQNITLPPYITNSYLLGNLL